VRRDRVILEVGLNEAASRQQNPHLPYSPHECADDALRCREAGAAVIHWHARDPATGASREGDAALYGEALDRMRQTSDVLGYPTYALEPAGDLDARLGHCWLLRARHGLEIAPIDVGSTNAVAWDASRRRLVSADVAVVQNSLHFTRAALDRFRELHLLPSVAAFDLGFTRTMVHLVEAGHLREPVFFKIFLLGAWPAGPVPCEEALEFHLKQIPGGLDVEWLVVPYLIDDPGLIERLCRRALALGGGVRIGIGDNPLAFPDATNAALVERAVAWCRDAGRPVAEPADVRSRFGLQLLGT
jgi:uncharacterized protein (DUF849 family)